jgi:hypothetical protein
MPTPWRAETWRAEPRKRPVCRTKRSTSGRVDRRLVVGIALTVLFGITVGGCTLRDLACQEHISP